MVMMRMISIIFGVAGVAVLSALISQTPGNSVPNEKPSAANESTSWMQINAKCGNSAEGVQAGNIIADIQTLTYRGYVVQKVNKRVRLETPPEYGPSSTVNVSYATISRRGKVIATFDAGVYFGLGNATEMGFFSLLDNGRKQLIISQDVPKGGRQWVVDFAKDAKIIFDGQKFGVGREGDDLSISDLDGDGIYEIEVPITRFYGFEKSRLTTSETPLPGIVFKFDSEQGRYLPANPLFKDCLLKDIAEAEKKFRSQSEHEVRLGNLMSVVLDYIFAGEEQRGWKFFEETCKLPDKAKIRSDMQDVLKAHPVYRYIYKKTPNR
jgi:hypothetical protein